MTNAEMQELERFRAKEAQRKAKSAERKAQALKALLSFRISNDGKSMGIVGVNPSYLGLDTWVQLTRPENLETLKAALRAAGYAPYGDPE